VRSVRYAEAFPNTETVLALDRNWVSALFDLGQCKLITAPIEETIRSSSEPSSSAPVIPSWAFGTNKSGRRI
jgi:hypothetical protein